MTDANNNPFYGTTFVTLPYNLGTPDDKTPYFRVSNEPSGSVLDSILIDESMGGTAQATAAAEHITTQFAPEFGWLRTMDTFSGDAEMLVSHGGVFTLARLYARTKGKGVLSPFDNPVDHYSKSESDWAKAKVVIYTTLFFQTGDGNSKQNLERAVMNAELFKSFRFVEDLILDTHNAAVSFHYNSYNVLNPSEVWNPMAPPV